MYHRVIFCIISGTDSLLFLLLCISESPRFVSLKTTRLVALMLRQQRRLGYLHLPVS